MNSSSLSPISVILSANGQVEFNALYSAFSNSLAPSLSRLSMSLLPARPFAIARVMSLVLVSPSTVIELNVYQPTRFSIS